MNIYDVLFANQRRVRDVHHVTCLFPSDNEHVMEVINVFLTKELLLLDFLDGQ